MYHHCLAKIMCNPPHPRCYLGEHDACPEIETLKEELLTHFDVIDDDYIVYKRGSPLIDVHWRQFVRQLRNLLILCAKR